MTDTDTPTSATTSQRGGAAGAGPAPTRRSQWIETNRLSLGDLSHALAAGASDVRNGGIYSLFFGIFYALGGVVLAVLATRFHVPWLIYPAAMGFVLLAPFVAMGLYDISRRLESGAPLSWEGVLGAIRAATKRDMRWMALITAFTFVIWMDMAALLTFGFLGFELNFSDLLHEIFTTPQGWLFLLVGNLVGALIASAVFSFSVVSFPLLYDRDIDFVTAMVTSVRLTLRNIPTMVVWAVIIGGLVIASILTGFLGLVIVLPLLGHATWHLYKRAIPPAGAAAAA